MWECKEVDVGICNVGLYKPESISSGVALAKGLRFRVRVY
jgi:hypothetical protein